jgi:hypothetical protein
MQVIRHILSFVFAGFLLISIIGVPVNDHYCGSSFVATNIGLPVNDPCGDMPMEGDCCEDHLVMYSVTEFFSNPDHTMISKVVPAILTCNYNQCVKPITQTRVTKTFAVHIPPPIESKLYLEIQSFLL